MCANQRYGWVNLQLGQVAELGENKPIQSIVLLDRHDDSDKQPQLESLPRSRALAQIVQHGFSLETNAKEALKCLSNIVRQAECYRLTYSTAEKAATYLCDKFFN
jgi:hypothetical protein